MNDDKHYIDSIYYQLELTAKYCRHLGNQLFEKLKLSITPDEFATLDTLNSNGEMSQRDLAKLILKDRPSTGRILSSLEKKGFITRVADTKNNRLIRKIALTDDAKKSLKKTTVIIKEYCKKIPKACSEMKVEELRRAIIEFRQSLQKVVEINI